MTEHSAFLKAVGELEAMLSDCVGLVDDKGDDHRKEMILLRRAMTEYTHKVMELGVQAFGNDANRNAYLAQYSVLRSAIARHQADWPISSYDPANTRYRASLHSVQDAYWVFMRWVRHAFAGI